jgi:small-conductance mechanosensitive channel
MKNLIDTLNLSSSGSINAIIAIGAFLLIAVIIDLIISKALKRLARVTKTTLDDRFFSIIRKPVFVTVIFIGILIAVSLIKPSEKAHYYIDGVIYSLISIIWIILAIKESNIVIEHVLSKISDVTGLQKDMIPLIKNITLIALLVLGVFVFLSIWKISVTPLLASAGIAGVVVALAAKDTLANFFGGISIFVDRPFKIGDYIVLDEKDRGEVVTIGIRSTRIKTRDDILITIPNAIIANTKIVNESAPIPKFRIRIPVGVAYGSDIDLVQDTLLSIAVENSNVVEDSEPRVRFRTFGDSSLNFELLCWVTEPAIRGLTIHELNTAIYKKFIEAGITIPFPQRDVHLFRENIG